MKTSWRETISPRTYRRYHIKISRKCGGARGLTEILWIVAEEPDAYLRCGDIPLEKYGFKPQAGQPNLKHQNQERCTCNICHEKQRYFCLSGRDN